MLDHAWSKAAAFDAARRPIAVLLATAWVSITACADTAPSLETASRPVPTPATAERTAGAPAQPPINTQPVAKGAVRVATVIIEPRNLAEEVVLTGELRADESVSLRSRTDGHVISLFFREGQLVRQGELLLRIADTVLQTERRRTVVQLDYARRREQRSKALLDEETISQDRYEESASRANELEATLAVTDARIALTEVRAPFDGTIGLRSVSVGSYLTPAVEIATLHAVNPIKLDLAAPERYAQRIHVGDLVRFEVTGLDKTFSGTVYAVEPRIDSETRTMRIRARAANPRARLLPGAFARARLTLGNRSDALMVPSIALIPGLESTTVFVVDNGVARPRVVITGTRTADQIEIVDGLRAGDEVIVSGVLQVQPGGNVEVAAEARP